MASIQDNKWRLQDIGVHIDSRSIEGAHKIGPAFKRSNEDSKILNFTLIAGPLKELIESDQYSSKEMRMARYWSSH